MGCILGRTEDRRMDQSLIESFRTGSSKNAEGKEGHTQYTIDNWHIYHVSSRNISDLVSLPFLIEAAIQDLHAEILNASHRQAKHPDKRSSSTRLDLYGEVSRKFTRF
jgi:hypothetical protein